MKYYCTLFDSAYMSRAIALYESLMVHETDAFLCFFCFDELSSKTLKDLNLNQAQVISLHDFENERLLAIKPTRNKGEYCWTCKASAITYVLDTFSADTCTYLDADLYLFAAPKVLLEEMKNSSVLLTPHRFSRKYDTSSLNGLYSAQYLTFRNDKNGREALNWWNNSCIDWCYGRHEENKYGDQKYLEQIAEFPGAEVVSHLGVIGPWAMQQFDFFVKDGLAYGREIRSAFEFNVVFFHFHDLKFLNNFQYINFGNYEIPKSAIHLLYRPYLSHLARINKQLSHLNEIQSIDEILYKRSWKNPLRFIKGKITGTPYIIKSNKLI